ncbi:Ran-specific GTPase-activating protein 30 [Ceratocystis lukuohia]|uniref:Ran-specific GTPase-activating protein 30 n=1 Tax=Ceratocystis lukuohia TaxID=2019550 RepID=A0ABR4MI80_9PEZI
MSNYHDNILAVHAMNMAIRSSLGLTSAYAFSQYSRLLATIEDGDVFQELKALEAKLESKIKTHQLKQVMSDLRSLLDDIDCNIPLLQLAITADGGGPSDSKPVWQEVIHKARVRIIRLPFETRFDHIRGYFVGNSSGYIPNEYVYHLEVIEDLDDGRLHESPDGARNYQEITRAGIRESIPLHQISKIFYTDTGRLLNIGPEDSLCNKPVLLLKRDMKAQSTESRVLDHSKWSFGEKVQAKRDSCNMDLSVQHREQGTIDMADDLQLDFQIRNEANEEDEAEGEDTGDEDDEEDSDASDSSSQSQKSLEKVIPSGRSFLRKLKNMSLAANLPGAETRNSQSQVSSVPAQEQQAVRLQPSPSPQPPPQPKDLVSGGLDQQKVREEARRQVGFDPYTDTPTNDD